MQKARVHLVQRLCAYAERDPNELAREWSQVMDGRISSPRSQPKYGGWSAAVGGW